MIHLDVENNQKKLNSKIITPDKQLESPLENLGASPTNKNKGSLSRRGSVAVQEMMNGLGKQKTTAGAKKVE